VDLGPTPPPDASVPHAAAFHGSVPAVGDVLAGQYRVERWLGDGGMGVVLAALDLKLHRDVALKLVQPELLSSESVRRSLEAEARSMASLVHPNVVTIYTVTEDAGRPFLVMELVDGPSLASVLRERGRLPPIEALPIIRAVAEGLTALHDAGLIHGDVKPSNILLGPSRVVKLTDMGLSQLLCEDEGGVVRGTPSYIPPERARAQAVPRPLLPRQDVYALAVSAFEMLTGRLPFVSSRPDVLIEKHAHELPPRPSEVCAGLAPAFDAPLLAALRKKPEHRTATPLELASQLELAARVPGRPGESVHILVVDDDEDWLTMIRLAILRRMPGVNVDLASDGEEALAMARRRVPAAALVDLRMPRVDGETLTRELRGIAGPDEMPIIVLTGEGSGRDWRRLRRIGADRFFVKPVIIDELCDSLEALLRVRATR
jgi:eukaryotic-like serine/threonine-protein kinase